MPTSTRSGVRFAVFIFVLLSFSMGLTQVRAAAQYTLLHGFAGGPSDGANPQYGSLATDGTTLYGFTLNGGTTNQGTVFKIGVNGSGYQTLHSFTGQILTSPGNPNDATYPYGTPLLIGSTLYGTTLYGGTNGIGTVFKINTDGSGFQLLHSFGGLNDGYAPYSSLVTDGTNLFGMTSASSAGPATIFKISTGGTNYSILHNFNPSASEGANPLGSLILSGGTLYGMAQMGGSLGDGTIFQIGTDGSGFQVIHNFTGVTTDGALPYGSLVISNTTLYGMTSSGGANNVGCVFSVDTSGSGFQILHSFSTATTWGPYGDLTLVNSTLYGMTHIGGTNGFGFGTIFGVNTDGSGFQIQHAFSYSPGINLTDGSTPHGSMIFLGSQLYGMTTLGGSIHNAGALFSFTPSSSGGGGGPAAGLQVTILPAAAVKAGAQWQVNGGALMKSGTLLSNLTAGAHVVSYSTIPGFTTPAPQIVDLTLGTTYPVTGTYIALDTTTPTLKVVTPTSKTTVLSNDFTATGTAGDNVGVALVYYQLNGGNWTQAATMNNWTNWSAANLTLTPGANVIKFYAKDLSGNVSPTNSVTFTYVVTAPLVVNLNLPKGGTFKPNLNGQLLQIGKTFGLSFKAAKGFAFINWTGGTNTTSSKITFLMASNLVFTANVKDIARPVNVILVPTKNTVLAGTTPMASGKAMDNVGVTAVWYRVNGGTWTMANLLDGTNWQTADLSTVLLSGADTISAYAADAAGNNSLTNTIAFTYAVQMGADWAPDSLNGLLATVTPAAGSSELVGFDISTFAQASTSASTSSEDYGAGAYNYLKLDTNHAQLSLMVTTPPSSSNNVGPVDLVFTNPYSGYFSNEDGGDTGQINLTIANSFVPVTVAGKMLTGVSGSSGKIIKIKLAAAGTFTKTPANNSSSGSSSGTYTFARFGSVNGMFAFTFTSLADAGQSAYVQVTFTSSKGGTYFAMVFDNLGNLLDTDAGNFTM